jgi:nucleoside-diphosphate-sugar epimerase
MADEWQVGVAVRHRRGTGLDEPDHRDERARKPEQAGEESRGAAADISKLRRIAGGFEPEIQWETGLAELVDACLATI